MFFSNSTQTWFHLELGDEVWVEIGIGNSGYKLCWAGIEKRQAIVWDLGDEPSWGDNLSS